MKAIYEPFILRRLAENRIALVNAKMPFEYYLDLFALETPFFIVTQLEDRRIGIVPNAVALPWNRLHEGFWPQDLLPLECEYVTMKELTYPVIITAHPVPNFDEWLMMFERLALRFVKQPLTDLTTARTDFIPMKLEERRIHKTVKPETVKV